MGPRTTRAAVCVMLVALALGSAPTAAGALPVDDLIVPIPMDAATGSYIVVLDEQPAVGYEGGILGLKPTAPDAGEKFDLYSTAAKKYTAHLQERQAEVAADAGVDPLATYRITLNGFSALMSPEDAARIAALDGVRAVYPDEILRPESAPEDDELDAEPIPDDEDSFPEIGPGDFYPEVWPEDVDPELDPDDLGAETTPEDDFGAETTPEDDEDVVDLGSTGEGVVVGVIDTGIAPGNPSFAGERLARAASSDESEPHLVGDEVVYVKADRREFRSARVTGETWSASDYSTKLIGAQVFAAGAVAAGFAFGLDEISPRDFDGHGSHVAGIAAGNADVDAAVDGVDLGVVSGVAPDARIAAYKACFVGADARSTTDDVCVLSDVLSALDRAVADGVDVLTYAIGGGSAEWGPEEIALHHAAVAGVFIAASAGNAGPAESSAVRAPAPWYTTVAASIVPSFEATIQLSSGFEAVGASVSLPAGSPISAPVIYAGDAGLAGAFDSQLCYPGTLDPELVEGRIVVCDRGTNPRGEKSQEVADAGGVGMVLANVTPGSIDADVDAVPTVHIDAADRTELLDQLRLDPDAAATLVGGNVAQTDTVGEVAAPRIAEFSARGPALADGGILVPDVTAPGASILGARQDQDGEPMWGIASGTSMAAAHVAGVAAAYLALNPSAMPDEVKSAIMTSASDTVHADGSANVNPFEQGAGHIDVGAALDPGLVYLSGKSEWAGYGPGGDGVGTDGTDADGPDAEGSALNLPSIAIGALAQQQTITRTVTATRAGTYVAAADIPGVDVSVQPSTLTFAAAGETQDFTVTLQNDTAVLGAWATGFLAWTHEADGTTVRSPLAVRPTPGVETLITADGAAGSAELSVAGTGASVAPTAWGLAPVTLLVDAAESAPGHSGDESSGDANGVAAWIVDIPAGSPMARFDLQASNDSDLGLAVYRVAGAADLRYHERWVAAPGPGPKNIEVHDPVEGAYLVTVDLHRAEPAMTWDLTSAVIGPASAAPLTVEPSDADAADPGLFALTWDGLQPGIRYLGVVRYGDSPTQTVVQVDAGVDPPTADEPPAVEGDPKVGATLTVRAGEWSQDDIVVSYQWLRDGEPIEGAVETEYVVTRADAGTEISVQEDAAVRGDFNTGTAVSEPLVIPVGSFVDVMMNRDIGTVDDSYAVMVEVTTVRGDPAEGSVNVWVDDATYAGTLADGRVTFILPPQLPGEHEVVAEYIGVTGIDGSRDRTLFTVEE